MAGINLIIHDCAVPKDTPRLRFIKSSSKNHICEIPYHLESYAPLVQYLSPHLPQEWIAEIESIRIQERALIQHRQQLMANYKAALADVLPQHITQFKIDHPEFFI